MFIAHIPSGYVLSVLLLQKFRPMRRFSAGVIAAGICGAEFPDVDLFYTYLIDHQRVHHHRYITHYPLLWFGLAALCAVWLWRAPHHRAAVLAMVFSLGSILHMFLDGFISAIWWSAPFAGKPYVMLNVPSLHAPWWWNYLLHWSFAVECAICAWALWLYRERSTASRQPLTAAEHAAAGCQWAPVPAGEQE